MRSRMKDQDCIFCKIVEGALPADKIYEDEMVVAFWDTRPSSPIHVLIVPKEHIPTLNDLPEGDQILAHIGAVATKLAKELGVAEKGYRFFINVNKDGGQVIFHLHAHLVAGKDFGVRMIRFAVLLSMIWRKLTGIFRKSASH